MSTVPNSFDEAMIDPISPSTVAEQIAEWWASAEAAIEAGQLPRARRFLRGILAFQADDEEAWLRLADLADSQQERIAYLRQAYAFHPHSQRTMAALRKARIQQLEAQVHRLDPKPVALHCLPDQRRTGPPSRPPWAHMSSNGHRSLVQVFMNLF
jgi:thioredoxin-like negative regulator of GroEL